MSSSDKTSSSAVNGNESSVKRDTASPLFGQRILQHFEFDPGHRNLNHGSFGASPRAIRKKLREYQDLAEAKPDQFIRYDTPDILNECREATAKLLNVPTETVVFVVNATTGVNTILRNIAWNDDCKDEIIYFKTIYGACGKTVDYIVDSGLGRVSARAIQIDYPQEDEEIVTTLKNTIEDCVKDGKRARICIFDIVSSLPAVRFPFEEVTKLCKEKGVLSLIDGAQGIGMIDLDLRALDPDFFVSNFHKWFYVPRSCALLYVPVRNQALIRSTIPTSHGYISNSGERFNPLPKKNESPFVNNFQFVGSTDSAAYLCVKDAIEWREQVLGGEARILEYIHALAKDGGKKAAQVLGTEVLDNKSGTMSRCATTNVALPLEVEEASQASDWMMETMMSEYGTFIPLFIHNGRPWARISAQVYLDIDDFEWAGRTLLELCTRVKRGEYKEA
ncbi:PLP-dependent transferase [Hypoxylon trugodes]|uniref:PLP-dependent transferase n=1 Tax=Hypoxylon trugodes TaxID=326681 RepID=UPI00219EF19B|nr:PLP-dependent transferase [Hypoxylon trugodes]KAI1383749.1 PLP-dependent transferase [Hypoxylon trugodes]